jgi:RimJ/RimL family protein N-acetyltransferase
MVELKPFTEADFQRVLGWIQSPEQMVQWAGAVQFSFPLDEHQLRAYLQLSQGEQPLSRIYKVVNETGEVVGHIELPSTALTARPRSAGC